jgi:hypothetical protein
MVAEAEGGGRVVGKIARLLQPVEIGSYRLLAGAKALHRLVQPG